jgi:ATP-dependent Clp protease ATP-binding subunit ClpA
MLSKSLESTLNKALAIATNYKHEYATFEHLLLALLEDVEACKVFQKYNVNLMSIYNQIDHYLRYELKALINEQCSAAKPTAGFQRVLHRAAIHGHATGYGYITGAHILAELFFEANAYAVNCMKEHGMARTDVINYLTQNTYNFEDISKINVKKYDDMLEKKKENIVINPIKSDSGASSILENKPQNPTNGNILATHCINLNNQASTGDIDNLVGRKIEIQRTIEILCRRQKNNVILVGEPGVGKTAIAEGLALRIVQGDVPPILKDAVIYTLDIGSLVSGTRYRGDFEERIKAIIQELKNKPYSILFIDEIHNIIGAGSTTTGSLDASNLLKPALARGDIRCIGATTFKEFHKHFEKDAALVRRFQKIVVQAPSAAETISILRGLKEYYEKHHNVTYEEEALAAAVALSERYITDRYLPDKAIDLIDEAGSRKKIESGIDKVITGKDIEIIVADIARIPSVVIATDEATKLQNLALNLKSVIFGQDHAVDTLCASIKLSKAGLRRSNKPIGCYMFAGPTGVGKTELAKQIAHFCNMQLVRFDMSEYSEAHTVSRLIGTPPGYVGFDQGGLLTEEVDKNAYSVVLLDEIEKASPDIFNLLLQVMDHGKLTDSTGKMVNFAHSIVIMTTNSGADQMSKTSLGFGKNADDDSGAVIGALDKIFSPEFRSRLDEMIIFNKITDKEIRKIVDKNITELSNQLLDKKVGINVDQSVRKYLAQQCLDSSKGARVLDRIIDTEVKQKIADSVLFGALRNGGEVWLHLMNGEIKFKFNESRTTVSAECVGV